LSGQILHLFQALGGEGGLDNNGHGIKPPEYQYNFSLKKESLQTNLF
jgi:hypothetical protein